MQEPGTTVIPDKDILHNMFLFVNFKIFKYQKLSLGWKTKFKSPTIVFFLIKVKLFFYLLLSITPVSRKINKYIMAYRN